MLSARIMEIDEQLVRSAARQIAEVLAEVEGNDMATTAARLDEIEETIQEHESTAEATHAQLLGATQAFDAIDGSDTAACAQQESEVLIARIARHAHTYARTRLSQGVVSRRGRAGRGGRRGPI